VAACSAGGSNPGGGGAQDYASFQSEENHPPICMQTAQQQCNIEAVSAKQPNMQ
jgi:hypothetical protein